MLECFSCLHLQGILEPTIRNKTVKKCIDKLSKFSSEFDSIAVSGFSCALISPIVAYELNKSIILIRKSIDDCVSGFVSEGIAPKKFIIIDDLVDSGKTIERIYKGVVEHCRRWRNNTEPQCVGLYLYDLTHSNISTNSQCLTNFGFPLLNYYIDDGK